MHITVNSLYHYIILSAATPQQSWTDKLEQFWLHWKKSCGRRKANTAYYEKNLSLVGLESVY